MSDIDGRAFGSVVVPAWQGANRDRRAYAEEALAWAVSAPVRELASASGWPEPATGITLLRQLVEWSDDWDFRHGRERNFIEESHVTIRGQRIDTQLVLEAAHSLGLVTPGPPPEVASDLVVLSGLVRACVNRTHYASRLLNGDLKVEGVAVLCAHRPLGGTEPALAEEVGLENVADEVDVAVMLTQRIFGLDPGNATVVSGSIGNHADPAVRTRASWSSWMWRTSGHPCRVEVLSAPSSDPATRRAGTFDQLRFWADRHDVDDARKVLLVTTQIYVPFQTFEAVRAIGFSRGCEIQVLGVDAASYRIPAREFGSADYLQEIRAALGSALALYEEAL